MANLVELSNQLEYVPQEQLVQMSQDPNSTYPSFLVLSEIQRRTQMKKMYEAQQPKPQTTVAEEVVQEFAGQQGLQGAMAQSPGPQNAFQPGDMGNMAPPSPMQGMAAGGKTGYNVGGLTRQNIAEANALGIDTTNLSSEEVLKQIQLANDKRRRDMLLGLTPNNQSPISQSLSASPKDLLNVQPLPEELQAQIDAAKEPSGFDKFVEGGTEFFFGPARPDAENPTLARMTDEPMDYLNYIPVLGTAGMYAKGGIKGIQGIIQGLRGSKAVDKADDVIDLTGTAAKTINKVDDIVPVSSTKGLPGAVPKTTTTPNLPATVPGQGVKTTNIPATIPGQGARTTKDIIPTRTGTDLIPQGGPLATIPKVTPKETKGLIARGMNWIKNNPVKSAIFGIGAGTVATYSGDPKQKDTDLDLPDNKITDTEIKRSFDPLDLAKLGGIIMSAKNTSELGEGLTALAADIQERKYKQSVLESKQQAMVIDKINALSKAMENMIPSSEEYKQAATTRQALIQSLYGPMTQGTDAQGILDAVTTNKEKNTTTDEKGILGSIKDTFMNMNPIAKLGVNTAKYIMDKDKSAPVIPQEDLYNAFVNNAPNPDYLTGDPIIDNIMRVESGGRDLTNPTTKATGPMQVKEMTLTNPGYGVEPAKDNSVEEKIRVGKDYYNAMREEFDGNDLYASIAYNLGPGATKKWLESGGSIEQLRQIQSSDGRPVGQAAIDYITKLYGPDIITRLG